MKPAPIRITDKLFRPMNDAIKQRWNVMMIMMINFKDRNSVVAPRFFCNKTETEDKTTFVKTTRIMTQFTLFVNSIGSIQ